MRFLAPYLLLFLLVGFSAPAENAYEVLVSEGGEKETYPLITLYQQVISRHDGPRCLFYPTCSEFCNQAFSQHGVFWGALMTLDRLFYRERPGSMKYYRLLDDEERYDDPVEHNYIFEKAGYYR
jgi:putative component of membrane protein insertase Oxa1/YidC/SpoIIIJ protein YidD